MEWMKWEWVEVFRALASIVFILIGAKAIVWGHKGLLQK